jgi:GNAT superfamily N-acetyltransferase
MSDNEFKAFSARFKVLPTEKARATVEKIGELLLEFRDGAMTPASYHAALWSLLDKLDRGERDATLKSANPARPGSELGRVDAGAAQGPAQGQDAARGSTAGKKIAVEEVGPDRLTEYARIPVAFEVQRVLRVESPGPGEWGFRLVEEPVSQAYVKDYDASDDPDGRVLNWPRRFDVSNWCFLMAHDGNELVGAATVAFRTPAVHMLEDRSDLAVLWDLRVQPARRGQGIGTSLFQHAADWALSKGCRQLKVETQNTNVPACRFYALQGCTLGGINRFGYAARPAVAHETMLLLYIDLAAVRRKPPADLDPDSRQPASRESQADGEPGAGV